MFIYSLVFHQYYSLQSLQGGQTENMCETSEMLLWDRVWVFGSVVNQTK